MAVTVRCRCGAAFSAVALDPLGARMEAWAVGWEYDAWTDGTVIDTCPGCQLADASALKVA